MPLTDCSCGCGWTKHIVINRYSVAEIDLLHEFEEKKRKAAIAVNVAREAKKLRAPAVCERCDRPGRTNAHHHDYDRPLDVEWLCNPCHFIADKERREQEGERFFGTTLALVNREAAAVINRSAA